MISDFPLRTHPRKPLWSQVFMQELTCVWPGPLPENKLLLSWLQIPIGFLLALMCEGKWTPFVQKHVQRVQISTTFWREKMLQHHQCCQESSRGWPAPIPTWGQNLPSLHLTKLSSTTENFLLYKIPWIWAFPTRCSSEPFFCDVYSNKFGNPTPSLPLEEKHITR